MAEFWDHPYLLLKTHHPAKQSVLTHQSDRLQYKSKQKTHDHISENTDVNEKWVHSRVWFTRTCLAIGKQAGVKSFKGPQQQRFGQRLIHSLLAGKVGVTGIHWAEREVVGEGVALSGLWMLDHSLLAIHEDDLWGLLSFLPVIEQNKKTSEMCCLSFFKQVACQCFIHRFSRTRL